MRATARVTTVATAAAVMAVVTAGWGSLVTAPGPGPATPTTPVSQPARGSTVVRVAPELLHGGIALPDGLVQVQPASRLVDGELRGWETAFDLHGVPRERVLLVLREDLTRLGFELRTGDGDVFGVRRHDDRWEIVVARVDSHGAAEDASQVLRLAIGSRPA